MRKRLLIVICLFAFKQTLSADLLLKAGANYSWFANEGGTGEPKPSAGLGLQFPLDESGKIKLSVNALYVGEKMILKDKTWPSSLLPIDECDLTSGNLYIHYHYLKLPIFLSSIVYQSHDFMSTIDFGWTFNFTMASSSDVDYYEFDKDLCEYDYERIDSENHPKYPNELLVGTGIYYKNWGVNLTYAYTVNKTEWLIGLKIQDHIHSIRMMLTWKLNVSPQKN